MFANFIGWLLTIGLMNGLIASLCLFAPLNAYESKVKKAKYEELNQKYRWSWDLREAYKAWEEKYDASRTKYWYLVLVLVIIIAFATAGVLTYADYQFENTPWTEENYVTHQIINLADNNEVSGRISGSRRYMTGSVSEITVYQYYYVTARGSWDLQKAGEKITEFFPTDGEPCAKWYRIHKKFWWNEETKYRCDIYIHENAMITDFIIDME